MVKMLSIGNSFSQDALAYFRDIALSQSFSVLEMIGLAVMVAAVMIMNLDGQRLPMR